MIDELESLLLVLAIGSAVAVAAKRIGIPYNVALVAVGLLIVVTGVVPRMSLDPAVVLVVFLPVLVFEGALSADAEGLQAMRRPILALAVPGVLVSLVSTAGVAAFLLGLPFSVSLLLGALLAVTDTVSVLVAVRSARVPHRLAAVMEGENLFNDGTALVLVSVMTGLVAGRGAMLGETARGLALAVIGGGALGGALGALGTALLHRLPDHLTAILASIVLVFATSLAAEHLHASPVIAVVVAGLSIGRAARRSLQPSRALALQGFWETCGFILNVLLFLLVGMQIHARELLAESGSVCLALLALHAGRAVAVYGCFGLLRPWAHARISARWQHAMVFGNIKGALSMAAVVALPETVPYRSRLITIVFGVTFVTLLTQGLWFSAFLRRLGLHHVSRAPELDLARADLVAARRGTAELDELLAAGLIARKEHAERRAAFQRLVIESEETLHAPGAAIDAVRIADLALVNAQKAALLDALRRGILTQDAADQRVGELDRKLVAILQHGDEWQRAEESGSI